MIDIDGNSVAVGDQVKVLKLPDVAFSREERVEVETMIGKIFKIESIEYGRAEVTKWWGTEQSPWCHSLFLMPQEFRAKGNDRAS